MTNSIKILLTVGLSMLICACNPFKEYERIKTIDKVLNEKEFIKLSIEYDEGCKATGEPQMDHLVQADTWKGKYFKIQKLGYFFNRDLDFKLEGGTGKYAQKIVENELDVKSGDVEATEAEVAEQAENTSEKGMKPITLQYKYVKQHKNHLMTVDIFKCSGDSNGTERCFTYKIKHDPDDGECGTDPHHHFGPDGAESHDSSSGGGREIP